MPLCLSRAGFLVTSITFTTWCSLAVTIHVHCATIAGSMWLWTYSRVELESCHFFSIYCLNEVFRWQTFSWAMPRIYKRQSLSTKLALKTHWLSQFSWSWIYLPLLLSLIQPLFFLKTVHCFFCDFLQYEWYIFCFFFFKRKAFYQFSPFNTNFERHRRFLVIHFFVRPKCFSAIWQGRHGTSISFLDDFSWRHCVSVNSCSPHKLPLLSQPLPLVGIALLQHWSCSHLHAFIKGSFLFLWQILPSCMIFVALSTQGSSFCDQSPGWQDINRRIPVFACLYRRSIMVICVFFVCVGKQSARRVCTECVEG